MDPRPYNTVRYEARGPFRVADASPGSRYEVTKGHAVYCAPTGGDGARSTVAGAEVLDTDPAVDEAGIDPGYTFTPGGPEMLRAPDIAVGNVPNKPGWVRGVPPLAVEYAGSGQDEADLQSKIKELLEAGTQWVWVIRLMGPRRVEVYTKCAPMETVGPGGELRAPGVLKNAVPIEALYDRKTAHELTLRNLLQRKGYADLEAVRGEGRDKGRDEGRDEGRHEGRAASLFAVLSARGFDVPDEERARIAACRDDALLDQWIRRAVTAEKLADILGA